MGQTLVGIISSQLTAEEIVILPEKLNESKPLGISDENWRWEMEGVSKDFLEEYWDRDVEWYINELKNKRYDRIYKYPSIETTSMWSILFIEPTLTCISFPVKYFPMLSEDPRIDLINSATRLAKFFSQNRMLLTYELGSGETHEEISGLKFKTLTNMVESFKQANRDFRLIEF